jgi:hypothetical protein
MEKSDVDTRKKSKGLRMIINGISPKTGKFHIQPKTESKPKISNIEIGNMAISKQFSKFIR